MKKENWVWMPHPGHLCISSDCKFFLNTYVGGYVVSTVGEYWPDRVCREIHAKHRDKKWLDENQHLRGDEFDHAYKERFGFREVGFQRKIETMVFKAEKTTHGCCPYKASDWLDIDTNGYNEAEEALKGHMKMCKKWARKK